MAMSLISLVDLDSFHAIELSLFSYRILLVNRVYHFSLYASVAIFGWIFHSVGGPMSQLEKLREIGYQ